MKSSEQVRDPEVPLYALNERLQVRFCLYPFKNKDKITYFSPF